MDGRSSEMKIEVEDGNEQKWYGICMVVRPAEIAASNALHTDCTLLFAGAPVFFSAAEGLDWTGEVKDCTVVQYYDGSWRSIAVGSE